MKILITGGTGVIGQGVIEALLKREHTIRLLSRHGEHDAKEWPDGVEGTDGDVGDALSILHKADGCDLVLHIAGIAMENPPEQTFEKVNVGGTRNMLSEARRAGVKRFVHISSLGADVGTSDYHKSKLASETLVRESDLNWTIVRPGNVFGPGDEVISLLLKMVRILPVIPVIDRGDQPFQPIWYRDMGEALARVVERDDLGHRMLEVGGVEITSMDDVIERLSNLTNRRPARVPVPNFVAHLTAAAASGLGFDIPIDENKLTMLVEENVVRGENALIGTLQMRATPLDEALRQLTDSLPEKLPSQGVGQLRQKRFWADIEASTYNRQELFERFRNSFHDVMPLAVHVEGETPRRLTEGETISMKLPLRGNIQVRVEKVTTSTIVLATLEGHPIAGFVRFDFRNNDGAIRFEVTVVDRSGSFFDLFAMETVGQTMQDRAWQTVVERVIQESGGRAATIETEETTLTGDEAHKAETWAEEIVMERKRKEHEANTGRAKLDDARR